MANISKKYKEKKEKKRLLLKRKSVICICKRKQPQKDRAKYGTSSCDGFSFSWSVGIVLSNAIYQFIADAKFWIVEEDSYWETLEKHADAIRAYAEADSWDKMTTVDMGKKTATTRMIEYNEKETAWREAMHWLTENWNGLWW
jgi:hypothetical protein